MPGHHFVSYSSVDGVDFAARIVDGLLMGAPSFRAWLDSRELRPGADWDEQLANAIQDCDTFLFLMTPDSVSPTSVCKQEWSRALARKKPVIPLRMQTGVEMPFRLATRQLIDFSEDTAKGLAALRGHLTWLGSPQGELSHLEYRLADARRDLPRVPEHERARVQAEIASLEAQITERKQAPGVARGVPRAHPSPAVAQNAPVPNRIAESLRGPTDGDSLVKRARLLRVDAHDASGMHRIELLREAHQLLQRANQSDPSNVDVLLEMASVLVELTPDDRSDEQKLYRKVKRLLADPANDRESFQLAQASFLLATSETPSDAGSVRDALAIFERLGRSDWARRCRAVLGDAPLDVSPPQREPSWPTAGFAAPVQSPPMPGPAPLSPASIVGNWRVDVQDMLQSKMFVSFLPNGACHGTQQAPLIGTVQFQGSWYFDPSNRRLAVQGTIGFVPTHFAIIIVAESTSGLRGVDDNGIGYVFQRA